VPIHFVVRERGVSKLSLRVQLQYLRQLGRLYLHRLGDAHPITLLILGLLLGGAAGWALLAAGPGWTGSLAKAGILAGAGGLGAVVLARGLAALAPDAFVAIERRPRWLPACALGALAGWGALSVVMLALRPASSGLVPLVGWACAALAGGLVLGQARWVRHEP
jgi:hypothetical protein